MICFLLCRLVTEGPLFLWIDMVEFLHLHQHHQLLQLVFFCLLVTVMKCDSFCWFELLDLVQATAHSQNQTVVVQNPTTVDESGKLVSSSLLVVFPLSLACCIPRNPYFVVSGRRKLIWFVFAIGEKRCCWCYNLGMWKNGTSTIGSVFLSWMAFLSCFKGVGVIFCADFHYNEYAVLELVVK